MELIFFRNTYFSGCIFVMVVATIVYLTDKETAKMADPIASIISAALLIILSYPYSMNCYFFHFLRLVELVKIGTLKTNFIRSERIVLRAIANDTESHRYRLVA